MENELARLLRLITSKLVNEAVRNPGNTVSTDTQDFKRLKRQVRDNEDAIPDYVEHLFASLKRSDSERRHALLSLFDYFFHRSHRFRQKTVDKLQELLILVCETDPLHHPLPGPSAEAKELKIYAIKAVKKWHEKFGPGYDKLNYVSDYLRESKAVDFDFATAELLAEKKRKEAEEQRNNAIFQKIVSNVRRKFDETKDDIERCIASADTALSILVPIFCTELEENNKAQSNGVEKPNGSEDNEMQHAAAHGYTQSDTISIVLNSLTPVVTVNEDNEALLENVRDAKVMLDVYRSKIMSWQRKISGANGIELLMRELTSVKVRVEQLCRKIDELKLKPKRRKRKGAESSDSEESDLEEVPEKQLEDFVPPDEVPQHIMERVQQMEREDSSDQPCCSKSLKPISSDSSSHTAEDKPEPKIPVVSFGLDLKYWGERIPEAPVPRNNADCHRFWRPPDDDDRPGVSEKEMGIGEVRVMTWIGEPQRAERRCKARLSNGKLCPRMDLRKCPLHGVIIDRDDEGFPIEEVAAAEQATAPNEQQERDEEEYLRDLEAGTGRSFATRPKKKKVREETTRERLEKKLLNPRTIKRVSEALDASRKARIQRKFGDQFAHALSK